MVVARELSKSRGVQIGGEINFFQKLKKRWSQYATIAVMLLTLLMVGNGWKRAHKANSTIASDASHRPRDLNMNDLSDIMVQPST
jgi:hypothetical protein